MRSMTRPRLDTRQVGTAVGALQYLAVMQLLLLQVIGKAEGQ